MPPEDPALTLTDAEIGALPPDLTPTLVAFVCEVGRWRGWYCSRARGHTGRHAAGNGTHIVAVWP
jgi:hypothetical protein